MALIKAYETRSGIEAPNAYHVIHKVDTFKRMVDDPDPHGARPENAPDHVWKAGYYGRISVVIYASKAAREAGKMPIAARAVYPTDVPGGYFAGEITTDTLLNFGIDINSPKSVVEQAYDHLLNLQCYENALND